MRKCEAVYRPFASDTSPKNKLTERDWENAVQELGKSKDRKSRLDEAVTLRDSYGRKYDWAKQIKELVDKMSSLTYCRNVDYLFLQ